MPNKNDVPLMFRAQIEGRCQLHRIYKGQDLSKIAQQEQVEPSRTIFGALGKSERFIFELLC